MGNPGAEGAHSCYRTQTGTGTHKPVAERPLLLPGRCRGPGTYRILLRATRDVQTPGDARNDIWIRVDGSTQAAPKFESGGQGFVK